MVGAGSTAFTPSDESSRRLTDSLQPRVGCDAMLTKRLRSSLGVWALAAIGEGSTDRPGNSTLVERGTNHAGDPDTR